jgi:magnesium chelatase subunit H
LLDLKATIDRWRGLDPNAAVERAGLAALIQAQAALVELADAEPAWGDGDAAVAARIQRISEKVLELEYTLIPHGLHVVGAALSADQRIEMLQAVADAAHGARVERAAVAAIVEGVAPEAALPISGLAADDESLAVLRKGATLIPLEELGRPRIDVISTLLGIFRCAPQSERGS